MSQRWTYPLGRKVRKFQPPNAASPARTRSRTRRRRCPRSAGRGAGPGLRPRPCGARRDPAWRRARASQVKTADPSAATALWVTATHVSRESLRGLFPVPAKLVAHGGQQAILEIRSAPRGEALVERGRENGGRHGLVDGGLDRPPALARVRDPARE